MKILAKSTTVNPSSLRFSEDKSKIIFDVTTEVYVEGNPYALITTSISKQALVTSVVITKLEILSTKVKLIDSLAQDLAQAWVDINYPIEG